MSATPEQATDPGRNRTGMDMAPRLGQEMRENITQVTPSSTGDQENADSLRCEYIHEAEPVGSVPMPGTVKGAFSTVAQKITGKKPEVLIDKLGERLAFERTGVRLYELLINKRTSLPDDAGIPTVQDLRQQQMQEAQHFALVRTCMESMGADPTAVTPSADTIAVASSGLLQVLSDPRTSLDQCLEAILTAELVDNDGWQMLVDLSSAMNMEDEAQSFQGALIQEQQHLNNVRAWLQHRMYNVAGVADQATQAPLI